MRSVPLKTSNAALQEGRNVDLKRLRDVCASLQKYGQPNASAEVRKIVLQHSVQNLLQGLRKQPLPSNFQASSHVLATTFIPFSREQGVLFAQAKSDSSHP